MMIPGTYFKTLCTPGEKKSYCGESCQRIQERSCKLLGVIMFETGSTTVNAVNLITNRLQKSDYIKKKWVGHINRVLLKRKLITGTY